MGLWRRWLVVGARLVVGICSALDTRERYL